MKNSPQNREPLWGLDPARPLPEPVALGTGRTAVRVELRAQGRDLLVQVTGGAAHAGAVAVADGRADAAPVLTVVPGHKEGPLAAEVAAALARAGRCVCVAVAGIHQPAATGEEIADIVAHVREAVARLVPRISKGAEK